ncbi:MAG: DUF6722 family protein [Thiomicrospira sp.]|jgi:hypothetical protein
MNISYKNKLADYLLDISKLIFAGVVLTTILEFENTSKLLVLAIGVYASMIIALIGFFLLEKE